MTTDVSELELAGLHPFTACAGSICSVHNPTNHTMRAWPVTWNERAKRVDRLCEHNVAHPDPDQFPYWNRAGQEWRSGHACDSCCGCEQDINISMLALQNMTLFAYDQMMEEARASVGLSRWADENGYGSYSLSGADE